MEARDSVTARVKLSLRSAALRVATVLLSLGLLGYVGYHLWRQFTSDVTTETAAISTVETVVCAEGYLFRQETLLFATVPGDYTAALAAGQKVGVGQAVAHVYGEVSQSVITRLAEIQDQISLLEDSSSGSFSLKDVSRLDATIQSLIVRLTAAVGGDDYSSVSSLRRELITAMNKRELIIGASYHAEDAIASLRVEAASLTASLGTCLETVTSPTGGYYYPEVDGYESVFASSALDGLTPEAFRALTEARAENTPLRCVGKLVTSYVWQVAALTDAATAAAFTVGDEYPVGFPYEGNCRVTMTLRAKTKSELDESVLLVFETDRMPEGFEFVRAQPLEIVAREYEGIRLPLSALRVVDGQTGVYVLEGSRVRFRRVKVIATVDGQYVVSPPPATDGDGWLGRNEAVIVRGKNLYDGRILT